MMELDKVITLKNICKNYGNVCALDGISFHIKKNEIVGYVGPNGAGKTTTIYIILGLIKPNKGEITVYGKNPYYENILNKIGCVLEIPNAYNSLTLEENLYFFGKLYGMNSSDINTKINYLLSMFSLSHKRREKFGKLSKGMKQKFAILKALLHNPEILILDEPQSGLDVEAQKDLIDILKNIKEERNVTLLFSSHNLFIVENLAERVIFIDKGKIKGDYKFYELFKKFNGKKMLIKKDNMLEVEKDRCYFKRKGEMFEILLEDERKYLSFKERIRSDLIINESPLNLYDIYDLIMKK